jgi:hypothetical protein
MIMKFTEQQLEILKGGSQKHFVIYYHIGTGTYVVTSPRAWARENSHLFPDIDFNVNHPTTNAICNLLRSDFGFKTQRYDAPRVSVTFKLDPLFAF